MKKKLYIIFSISIILLFMALILFICIINTDNDNEVFPISLGVVKSFIIKGNRKLIIVDTGEDGYEKKILKKIKELGFQPNQVSLILITHGHIDHFGSAGKLKDLTGADIAIHDKDKRFLMEGIYAPVIPISWKGYLIKKLFIHIDKKIPGIMPDVTFTDELDLKKYGVNGKVISTPGHTEGTVSEIPHV